MKNMLLVFGQQWASSLIMLYTVWVKGFPTFLFRDTQLGLTEDGALSQHIEAGADLNHRRTRAQLSLAVVIIPQPLSDRWHCGISDFMAGHLSYPISFPIWWEVLAPVKFILQFEYWSDSALSLSLTPSFSQSLCLFSSPTSTAASLRRLNGLLLLAPGLGCWCLSQWCTANLHGKKKTWINMSWICKSLNKHAFVNSQFSRLH